MSERLTSSRATQMLRDLIRHKRLLVMQYDVCRARRCTAWVSIFHYSLLISSLYVPTDSSVSSRIAISYPRQEAAPPSCFLC